MPKPPTPLATIAVNLAVRVSASKNSGYEGASMEKLGRGMIGAHYSKVPAVTGAAGGDWW